MKRMKTQICGDTCSRLDNYPPECAGWRVIWLWLLAAGFVFPVSTRAVETSPPEPNALLAEYKQGASRTLLQAKRWLSKSEENCLLSIEVNKVPSVSIKIPRQYTVIRDNGRFDSRRQQTQLFEREQDSPTGTRIFEHRFQTLINEGRALWYSSSVKSEKNKNEDHWKFTPVITSTKKLSIHRKASLPMVENVVAGYCIYDYGKPVWEILKDQASVLRVRPSIEIIDGHETYVLEADTPHGQYRLWLDPACGFLPRRLEQHKSSGDLAGEKPLGRPHDDVSGAESIATSPVAVDVSLTMHSVQIERVEGVFVPISGVIDYIQNLSDGQKKHAEYSYRRTEFDLDPDFESVPDAFMLLVPNGTKVYDKEFPSVEYEWFNGELRSKVDEAFLDVLDNKIAQLKIEVKAEFNESSDRKAATAPNEPAALAATQPKTQVDTTMTQPEVVAESGSSTIVLVILIGLLIIGVIGWLVFQTVKS